MTDDAEEPRTGRLATWWWDRSLRAKGIITLALPALVIVPAMVATVLLVRNQETYRQRGRADRAVELEVQDAAQLVSDAESSVRGYLASGDPVYLDRFGDAEAQYPTVAAALRDGTVDELTPWIEQLLTESRTLLDELAALRDGGLPPDPVAIASAATSMDEVRTTLATIDTSIRERLVDSRAAVDLRGRAIFFTLVGGMLVGIVGGLIGIVSFARSIGKRVQLVNDAAERVLAGEELPPLETPARDEIGQLINRLNDAAGMLLGVNDTLAVSRDQALAATRAKDEFLSRMSHELRTPLSAILGFGQLLQMEDLADDDRDAVDHIVKAGRHLLELINDLLDISRIATGYLTLSLEPIALREMAVGVVALLRPQARDRGVTVRTDIEPTLMAVADNQRLRQVLLNLLSNAIKYNRDNGEVTIAADRTAAGVRLSVTDTGNGLSESDRERLFMPFERLHATNSAIEGTGVGLALSKSLVEAMGGTIGVDAEVGVGSTFWVDLPVAAPAEPEPLRPLPVATEAAERAAAGSGRFVLYVEDNLANVRVMERLMRDRPERLEVAVQGGMAIELARRLHPGLILLDLHLPDLLGDEVLTELKADPRTADIPVVMLSADASEGARRRVLELGAHRFLTKPIDVAGVLALLDEVAGAPASTPAPGPAQHAVVPR